MERETCYINKDIVCNRRGCKNCGFNKVEADRRKAEIKKHGLTYVVSMIDGEKRTYKTLLV